MHNPNYLLYRAFYRKILSILGLEHCSGPHNAPPTAYMQLHCQDSCVDDKTLMLMVFGHGPLGTVSFSCVHEEFSTLLGYQKAPFPPSCEAASGNQLASQKKLSPQPTLLPATLMAISLWNCERIDCHCLGYAAWAARGTDPFLVFLRAASSPVSHLTAPLPFHFPTTVVSKKACHKAWSPEFSEINGVINSRFQRTEKNGVSAIAAFLCAPSVFLRL